MRVELKKKMIRVEKKTWVEMERTLTSFVVNGCLHFAKMRLWSKEAVNWLRILQIFSSLLLDLSRTRRCNLVQHHVTGQNSYFGTLMSTKGHNSVVKILWDFWLFKNREVHPCYVKSDWNPLVQPSVALKSSLGDKITTSQNITWQ